MHHQSTTFQTFIKLFTTTSACDSALERTLCPLNGWPPNRACSCPKLPRARRRHKQIYNPINPKGIHNTMSNLN